MKWRTDGQTPLCPASAARIGGLGLGYPAMLNKTNIVRGSYPGSRGNPCNELKINELSWFEGLGKKEGSQKTTSKPGMYVITKGEKMEIEVSPAMLLKNQHVIPLIRGC